MIDDNLGWNGQISSRQVGKWSGPTETKIVYYQVTAEYFKTSDAVTVSDFDKLRTKKIQN